MSKNYYYSGTKKSVTVLLQIVMFLLALVTIATFFVTFYLGNSEDYYVRILGDNGEFDTVILNSVEKAFQRPNSIVNIPPEELYDTVDKDKIIEGAHTYVKSALDYIFKKTPLVPANYDYPELQADIQDYFDNHKILQASDAEVAKVKEYYLSLANSQSNFISDRLVKKAGSLVGLERICSISKIVFFVGMAAMLFTAAGIIFINRDNVSRALYKTTAPCWIASVTLAIPTYILAFNRISAKLNISESPFKRFITEIVKKVEDNLTTWNTIHIILFTILTILFLLYYSGAQNKRHREMD